MQGRGIVSNTGGSCSNQTNRNMQKASWAERE